MIRASKVKIDGLLARKQRLNAQRGGPRLLTISGDPEIRKLKDLGKLAPGAMGSDREAMIGPDHFEAAPDEPTKAFHSRMLKIAGDRAVLWVDLGHPDNNKPMVKAPPYPPPRDGAKGILNDVSPTRPDRLH